MAPKRVVYPEGEEAKIIRAAHIVEAEGIAHPILLGRREVIYQKIEELGLNFEPETLCVMDSPKLDAYAEALYQLRQRKGVTRQEARRLLRDPNYYGVMMVYMGDADACVSGLVHHYPEVLRPALQIVKTKPGVRKVAAMYMMVLKDRVLFFSDPAVNIEPTAEDLAEIAILAADMVREFDIEPRIAMLSFSNFGSVRHPLAEKVRRAVELVREKRPDLVIDGEMMADTAVVPEIVETYYPFSRVKNANVLIFPDLEAANVAYKLLQRLGGAEAFGPILMGMGKAVHVLQMADEVKDIVNVTAIAVVDAQEIEARAARA